MARTIEEIQSEILTVASNSNELGALEILTTNEVSAAAITTTSKTSIWRLFIFIISYSIQLLEKLYDAHKVEVNNLIRNQKSGSLPWYRSIALDFQYGFSLLSESEIYDNTGATLSDIENSKVVKYAAVSEGTDRGLIVMKIASSLGGVLSPVTNDQLEAFTAYISRRKYAGTRVQIRNYNPDKLFIVIEIRRDPMLLTFEGISTSTGENVIQNAINQFLMTLPFNGELILAHLVDALQVVPGVLIPTLVEVKSAAINPGTGEYDEAQPINISKIPESGYFIVDSFDSITYVV